MGRIAKEIKEQRLKDAAEDLNEALEDAYPVLYDAACFLPKPEQKLQARAAYEKAKLALYKAFKG